MLSKVLSSGGQSATTVSFLLNMLNALLVCGHRPVLNSLQSNVNSIIGKFSYAVIYGMLLCPG